MAKGDDPPPAGVSKPVVNNNASTKGPFGLGEDGKKLVHGGWNLFGLKPPQNGGLLTVDGALRRFQTLAETNPDQYAAIQAYLFRGGFYSNNYTLVPGHYRKEDFNAFKDALRAIGQSGANGPKYLIDQAAAYEQYAAPRGGGKAPSLPIQVTDPADIRTAIDAFVPDKLGRGLSDEEKDLYVRLYQQMEEDQQRQAFNTHQADGVVARVSTVPNLRTFIEGEAERRHPEEAKVKAMANLSQQFLAGIQSVPGQVDREF